MKIQGPNGPPGPQRPEGTAPSGAQRAADSSNAAPSDRAEFSDEARRVAALADTAASLSEVRIDRVQTLRAEISDGTYRVDARSLARAVLEFEDDFARR